MIKVMIVDDSPESLDYFSGLFDKDSKFEVVGRFADGKSLIDSIFTLSPDVVILDTFLPDKDGVELTEIIKDEHPDIKVILITTVWDAVMERLALETGALAYLSKIGLKPEKIFKLVAAN